MSNRSSSRLPYLGLCLLIIGCGRDHIGELIAQLGNPDVVVRRAAARELGEKTAADARVVAALAKAVGDNDAEVRRLSIFALGQVGASAKSSLPVLEAALHEADAAIRVKAALAIQQIDPQNRSGVPVLNGAMRGGDGRTMLAVGALGEDAAWAVPTLTELLSHSEPQLRALAAQTLGRIGPPAGDAKPTLQRALRDPSVAVQDAARAALDRIDTQSRSTAK